MAEEFAARYKFRKILTRLREGLMQSGHKMAMIDSYKPSTLIESINGNFVFDFCQTYFSYKSQNIFTRN